jgi:L-alanine-DL-glutamate epimerase-like enolase superfamily enzyme
MAGLNADIKIERVDVSAFRIPTDFPESDGTLEWADTTLVLVELLGGNYSGLGYTFADTATAQLIKDKLSHVITGADVMAIQARWLDMVGSIRNLGRPGIASMAISAVDIALWDLKARLLNLPLVILLGQVREQVAVYGSGGFTSYSISQLQRQLAHWVEQGMQRVKMKIGRNPSEDLDRVCAAREAIGPEAELFVDANGAYGRKQALAQAERFAASRVSWFEEPVSSDDLEGLRLMRDRAPACMDIAAGEYGYDLFYFRRMLDAEAVDILQADATRCGGFTGFLSVASLCQARAMRLPAHTAPSLHAHACCALSPVCHVEYFHDHSRIEQMLFDGALKAENGTLRPDLTRTGLGIEFKRADAERFAI